MAKRTLLALTYTLLLTGFSATLAISGWMLFDWSPMILFAVSLGGLGLGSAAFLQLVVTSSYVIGERTLEVAQSGGHRQVLFQSILSVEHIRQRSRDAVRDAVRIVYRQGSQMKELELRPKDATLFTHDLLAKCPHLTRFQQNTLRPAPEEASVEGPGLMNTLLA